MINVYDGLSLGSRCEGLALWSEDEARLPWMRFNQNRQGNASHMQQRHMRAGGRRAENAQAHVHLCTCALVHMCTCARSFHSRTPTRNVCRTCCFVVIHDTATRIPSAHVDMLWVHAVHRAEPYCQELGLLPRPNANSAFYLIFLCL